MHERVSVCLGASEKERKTVFKINFIFLSREIGLADLAAKGRELLIFLIYFCKTSFLVFQISLFLLSDRAVLSVSILTLAG